MKHISIISILLILCLLFSSACAEQQSPVIMADFDASDFTMLADSNLLLSGSVNTESGNSIAAIRVCDLEGNILWEKQESEYSSYCAAEVANSDALYAVAVVQSGDSGVSFGILQCMVDGQVVASTDSYEGLDGLYPTSDGFWTASVEIDHSQSVLRKFDFDLNLVCELVLDGHVFLQILPGDEYNIACGYSQQMDRSQSESVTPEPEQSVLFAFDDEGQILWQNEGMLHEAYTSAIWTESGKFALIGRTPLNGDPEQFFSEYFLAEYAGDQLVSRTDLKDSSSIEDVYRDPLSIYPLDNGYLLPLEPLAGDGVVCLHVNPEDAACEQIISANSLPMTLWDGEIFCKDDAYYLVGCMGYETVVLELFSVERIAD